MSNDKFEFFGWDETPIGKYKQPKPNTYPPGKQKDTGYPDQGVDWDDVRVKGRYMSGTKKKTRMDIRGAGAATKGKKFYNSDYED